MDLGWDRDQELQHELTLLGVPEAEHALLEKYVGLCSKPIVHIDLISVGDLDLQCLANAPATRLEGLVGL